MKILLLGSSIIKQWKSFNIYGYEIINKGIPGLLTNSLSSSQYLKEISKVKKPEYIFFYCGGNDLRKNIEPHIVLNNIIKFIQELRNMFFDSRIIIISIIKSPIMYEKNRIENINHINKYLKKITKNNFFNLDVNDELDKKDYFKKDMLHINNIGYNKLNIKINNIFDKINKNVVP
jgi:lysophospholipase L1-like esterase